MIRVVIKKSYFSILSFFLLCVSCVYNHESNSQDLGDNYYYLADASESQILLNLKPNQASKVGKTIIPQEVLEYNFDKSFIIAKNIGVDKIQQYWIVDKMANKIDSMDFSTFSKRLKERNINLKLLPRK